MRRHADARLMPLLLRHVTLLFCCCHAAAIAPRHYYLLRRFFCRHALRCCLMPCFRFDAVFIFLAIDYADAADAAALMPRRRRYDFFDFRH